ncbi:MAG: CinA family protein [Fibrobacter sp.]|nr:CinA family protein [Fibrobacter sp.]
MTEQLALEIGKQLISRNWSLSVAESCTGGLLGGALTEIPGASGYFLGGVIAYDNRVKISLLNVPGGVIDEFGAVSSQTVTAMARGACELFNTECAISISGIAGPEGGSAVKPVGLVFTGIAVKGTLRSFENVFKGNRQEVRCQAVEKSLSLFLETITQDR